MRLPVMIGVCALALSLGGCIKGEKGDAGPAGPAGPKGEAGAAGAAGPAGPKGDSASGGSNLYAVRGAGKLACDQGGEPIALTCQAATGSVSSSGSECSGGAAGILVCMK